MSVSRQIRRLLAPWTLAALAACSPSKISSSDGQPGTPEPGTTPPGTTPAERLTGAVPTSYPHAVTSTRIDTNALPNLTAWYQSTSGWFSFHGRCTGGNNLDATSGRLTLNDDYCSGGHAYAIAVGAGK